MSDSTTRRHQRLMDAWLHRWSDDRAREIRKQRQENSQSEGTQNKATGPKIKPPSV